MAVALPFIAAAAAGGGGADPAAGRGGARGHGAAAERYNAQVEAQRASEATQAAQANAAIVQTQTRQKMGEAAAAFGAGGVDMSGSPLAVMSGLAGQGELSRQITLYQGKLQALSASSAGGLDTTQAGISQSAGYTRAAGTLLTGAGAAGRTLLPYLSAPTPPAGPSPAAP